MADNTTPQPAAAPAAAPAAPAAKPADAKPLEPGVATGPGEDTTTPGPSDSKPAVALSFTTDSQAIHEDDTVRVEKSGERFDWYDKTGNAAGPSPDAGKPAPRAIRPAQGGEPARHETDEEAQESVDRAKDSTVK